MIEKWYEVSCDQCGCGITHTRSSSKEELRLYGVIVRGRRHFCSSLCLQEWLVQQKSNKSK